MLVELTIKNIALIDELTIAFSEGLNVLTGETGAGKSIVIDSMNLAVGERADRDLIRGGEEKAQVHALFDLQKNKAAIALLAENGIEIEGGELVVSRELSISGRNVVRMNGALVPLALLKRLSALLVDIHGQHEHQSLLNENLHIEYLDGFARDALGPKKEKVAKLYATWHEGAARLKKITGNAQMRAQRLDMLLYQCEEIENARLRAGEEEELIERRNLFRNAEKIAAALSGASGMLEGEEMESGALDLLRQAQALIGTVTSYSKDLSQMEETLSDALYALEDVAAQLSDQMQELDFNPRELGEVEERLELIRGLKRKYGASIEEILDYLNRISAEVLELQGDEQGSEALEKQVAQAEKELVIAEGELTEGRKQAARSFEQGLSAQLADLGMASARFQVEFIEEEKAGVHSENGVDAVRFLLSANRGEPLKALSHTASGGELSRIMLAFKTICAGDVGTMVFDEIDTGISGRMAQVVGEKMCAIGASRQVIAVTHLPQIAALGHSHHLIVKAEEGGRTVTRVKRLNDEERIEELAKIAGGTQLTQAAVQHARELLDLGKKLQCNISTKN